LAALSLKHSSPNHSKQLQNPTPETGPFRSHKPAQDLEAWETSAVEPKPTAHCRESKWLFDHQNADTLGTLKIPTPLRTQSPAYDKNEIPFFKN
jgi:hypothetical protein